MPLLNFQKRFAEKVRTGEKRQSIRAYRKIPFKTGDKLYLYTGLRTKNTEKLGEGILIELYNIEIYEDEFLIRNIGLYNKTSKLDFFACEDGFDNWQELIEWFGKAHGLPFQGQLLKWKLR